MKLGAVIKMLRARRAMTLAALAEASGLSSSYLSLVESGKRTPPIGTMEKIAASLSVPVVALIALSTPLHELSGIAESTKSKLMEALMLLIQDLNDAPTDIPSQSDPDS